MIEKNVKLWLGDGPLVSVRVSQFDTMWRFVFGIVNNSQPWTIPSGAEAVLNGRKPDDNVFSFSGTIADNKVAVDCDVQMTAVAGQTVCELSILAEGKVVGTANFTLDVEAAPKSPDDVSSDSTLPAYGELLEMFSGDITDAVDDWLDDHSGEIGGLTNQAKQALLTLLGHVYFDEEHGPEYIEELRVALYPPISITAVFTQGSAVIYNTDTLDTLRQYLTVTASYSGGVTEVVTGYTLSGSLTVGTSTITATYGGKTDTFNVTVTKKVNSLVNGTYVAHNNNSVTITVTGNSTLTYGSVAGTYPRFIVPLTESFAVHTGDVIVFSGVGDGGATSNAAISIGFNDSYLDGGGSLCPFRATPTKKTRTMTEDVTVTKLMISNWPVDRSFTLSITINGEEVFS